MRTKQYCRRATTTVLPIIAAAAMLTAASSLGAQEAVSIVSADVPDGYELRASNTHVVPVFLSVDLVSVTNLAPSAELPVGALVGPGASDVPVLTLSPTTDRGRMAYRVSYRYAFGDPRTASHDDDFAYLLPFAHGTKRRLSQGFHGQFTHYGENEYAVDFEMPVGTPVFAARGGLVADVKEASNAGGPSSSYEDHANRILIAHPDGSFGNYVHLREDGALVTPGDRVEAGQLIGYSGNTGRSSGPHLHFDVRLPREDGTNMSIPFRFAGAGGQPFDPQEGVYYYAYHPGGGSFEEELGSQLSLVDFADYTAPVALTESLETRVEQVDLTFILYVRNGFQDATDIQITLDLRGMTSDAGNPVELTVPAATEVVATILRPQPGATSIRYGYTVRYWR